jgi:hypothetical protein
MIFENYDSNLGRSKVPTIHRLIAETFRANNGTWLNKTVATNEAVVQYGRTGFQDRITSKFRKAAQVGVGVNLAMLSNRRTFFEDSERAYVNRIRNLH